MEAPLAPGAEAQHRGPSRSEQSLRRSDQRVDVPCRFVQPLGVVFATLLQGISDCLLGGQDRLKQNQGNFC